MRVFRWLGRFTMVAGPLLVLLLFVLTAFVMWVVVTGPGTRWALTTAIEALDGEIHDVRGSVWRGVEVGKVSLDLPAVGLQLENLQLRAEWRSLLERQVYVQALKADTAWVDLRTTADEPEAPQSDEPFSMPQLPVTLRLDDLALGELILTQDGRPLPMTLQDLSAALAVDAQHGQLWLRNVSVATDSIDASLEGEAELEALQHPWPMVVDVALRANGLRPGAPVCFRNYLPTLPTGKAEVDLLDRLFAGAAPDGCPVELNATVQGSLDELSVVMRGSGQGMKLDAKADLAPMAGMPLRSADVALVLPDASSLTARVGWEQAADKDGTVESRQPVQDASGAAPVERAESAAGGGALSSQPVDTLSAPSVLVGELNAKNLDVGGLSGGAVPPAVLGLDGRFRLELDAAQAVRGADVDMKFHEGSRWNEEPLSGSVSVAATLPASWSGPDNRLMPAALNEVALHRMDIDLDLGKNRIHSKGGIGPADSRLQLDVAAPKLASFWPDLPGGVFLKGHVDGGIAAHAVNLEGRYLMADAASKELGSAPVALALKAQGAWGGDPEGWRGRITQFKVDHAHLGVNVSQAVDVAYIPGAVAPAWRWTVGATQIGLNVNGRPMVSLRHAGSMGGIGRWKTEGRIERFLISPQVLNQIGADFNIAALQKDERGGVKVRGARSADDWELAMGLGWNLSFDGAHRGSIQLQRLSGDLMVPAATPFPLGLETLNLDMKLAPSNGSRSQLHADLEVGTKRMGRVKATAVTALHATPAGGIILNPADTKTVTVDAAIADLGWTSLLVGDALDIGGAVQAQLKLVSRPDGSWNSAGTITGKDLRVVMIDQGVRLLEGTLQARLDNERLILERLHFPARLRAEPKEWRTAEWISTNPDAKGGSLVVSGDWNLFESQGVINVDLHRFPILQRADRYAMMTGGLKVDAKLPNVAITGKLTADAGWFDLDMLGGIPTVDSDVVVVQAGENPNEPKVPIGISLDLEVDLGQRFYLTGYGLNSGLVGSMRVVMRDGKLTGVGALRTRGGAIEAYGQRLQLRRGAITFQGDITRPVLDIEALRTGLAVEAGVRVAGTARNPRIELVSYPAVSEIEKLSWLLLGHGPNDSGGDMALLFSVGSSFLSDGEPFYRRFGIDEVSMRSGELGSVASILPVESVVSGLDTGTSDIERRFINVSKRLSSGVTLSIRQALSDTGTVARASYRLARGLTAEASVGTINGLALVYRWFSREQQPQSGQ